MSGKDFYVETMLNLLKNIEADIKSGHIVGLTFAGVYKNGNIGTGWVGSEHMPRATLIGAASILHGRMIDHVLSDNDEAEQDQDQEQEAPHPMAKFMS
jgi:hypothetical protein